MLIIDRFEGNIAIIEYDGKTFNLPCELLPEGAEEGDIIRIIIDKKGTTERREQIEKLMDELFE